MKKIVLICDRCGKQYNSWGTKWKELYGIAKIDYSDFEPMFDMKMDLCEPCYLSFKKWLNDPEIIELEKWVRNPEPYDEHIGSVPTIIEGSDSE